MNTIMDATVSDKSFHFALRIVKLSRYLKEKNEYVMSRQLLRAGTSIGANIAEGEQAQSRPDFISKLGIALKEAAETNYWLRLLHGSGYLTDAEFASIFNDCRELERMLTAIIKTTKN